MNLLCLGLLALSSLQAKANDEPHLFLGNNNIPPMLFQDNGQPMGIVADLFEALSEEIENEAIVFELDDWQKAQERVRAGEAAGLLQLNRNPAREEYLLFSDTLLVSEFVIFHHADRKDIKRVEDLFGLKVAVEPAGYPASILNRHSPIKPVFVGSWELGFKMVQDGTVDALITDRWVGEYILAHSQLKNITVAARPIEKLVSHIAVTKDHPELLKAINEALARLHSSGRFETILNRWRGSQVVYISAREKQLQEYIEIALGIVLFLLALLILQALRLRNRNTQIQKQNEILEERVLERTEQLRHEKKRLEEIVWGTQTATWEWDIPSDTASFNERWAEMIGYSLSELAPTTFKTWEAFTHPDDLAASKALLERHFRDESSHYETEIRMKHRHGHWVWILSRGKVAEWTEDGRPQRMSGTHIDITRLKNAELALLESQEALENQLLQTRKAHENLAVQAKELANKAREEAYLRTKAEAAEKSKSEFFASMSHEIRTPMTGIMGFVELLLQDDLTRAARDKAEMIRNSSQSLLTIINDILDLSKLEAERLELEELNFDVAGLAAEVIEQTKGACSPEKLENLAISFNPETFLPEKLHADPTRLRQVLLNLLGNAVKFTEHGAITLHCHNDPSLSLITFKVQDTGIGIEDAVQTRLFKEYMQADSSISRKYQGTGLGLAISKRLVELMGGEIGVESAKGEGSLFWFTFPYKPALESGEAPEDTILHGKEEVEATSPLSILVAEDNAINQTIIETFLRNMGHNLTLVKNGLEAVQAVREKDFDLILMDVRMPELSGPDASRQIRRLPAPKNNIPIIAVTADLMGESHEDYLAAGMNDCVGKPINFGELARSIVKNTRTRTLAKAE
ncbi:ATP-binding protein [Kiloniella sp. b19]|uniref:ATP-binding protein n=1 Tax=Kiloniella sp. GXU_MW_B19 TaxID=3141326 RepID=UPI0031D47473